MEKVILVLLINGKLKISSKNLLCELANNVQYLEVGKKTLVKFIVKGLRGDPKNVNFEVNPNGIFELTTSKWKEIKAKTLMGENWRLQTYITAKKEGEANIQVIVDGKKLNTIKLTTKVQAGKDVFGAEDVKRLIEEMVYIHDSIENKVSIEYGGNYCLAAAERGLSELLQDEINFYSVEKGTHKRKNKISFNKKTAMMRGKRFEELGFVKRSFTFDKYKMINSKRMQINNATDYNKAYAEYHNVKYDIITLDDNVRKVLLNEFKLDIKGKIGFHVYYFSVTDGFHTLLLIINNLDPCNAEYEVYDQHGKTNSFGKLSDISEGLRIQTSWTFANSCLNRYAANKTQSYDSTKTKLWKIQKK